MEYLLTFSREHDGERRLIGRNEIYAFPKSMEDKLSEERLIVSGVLDLPEEFSSRFYVGEEGILKRLRQEIGGYNRYETGIQIKTLGNSFDIFSYFDPFEFNYLVEEAWDFLHLRCDIPLTKSEYATHRFRKMLDDPDFTIDVSFFLSLQDSLLYAISYGDKSLLNAFLPESLRGDGAVLGVGSVKDLPVEYLCTKERYFFNSTESKDRDISPPTIVFPTLSRYARFYCGQGIFDRTSILEKEVQGR